MSPANTSRGESTRETILTVAHNLFIQQGYHGTSMRQIAKDAGIALGGIYNHFSGKEDIFKAVFFEYHPYREVLPTVEAARGGTVEELLHHAADHMLAAIDKHPHFLNLIFIEIVEFKSAHSQELFNQLFPRGMVILDRLRETGDRLRPIPEPVLIRAFVGLFFSYYLTELIIGNIAPPEFSENAMQHLVDIYLHGILQKE